MVITGCASTEVHNDKLSKTIAGTPLSVLVARYGPPSTSYKFEMNYPNLAYQWGTGHKQAVYSSGVSTTQGTINGQPFHAVTQGAPQEIGQGMVGCIMTVVIDADTQLARVVGLEGEASACRSFNA